MDQVQTVVVGAGVIGLAIARHLARRGHEVVVLEAENAIGQHTSSRNSQVIHAGIYYPKGSDQQRLCLRGRDMLFDYCASRHVGHQRCGKLTLAATTKDTAALASICQTGRENGVSDLRLISKDEVRELEPQVVSEGAMISPSSGIVDAPGLMLSLLGEAESAGAMLALNARLVQTRISDGRFILGIAGQAETEIATQNLINAAALGSWDVATSIQGFPAALIPPRHLAKGNYFSISGKSPFSRLVYPMPQVGSLGIHSVQDLAGGVRFGPNMEWVDELDYRVDESLKPAFEQAIRTYWPGLPDGALAPDIAGIRPRIWGAGQPKKQFLFQGPAQHGINGLIQLFGFESPGLTSCLAIAEHVGKMMNVPLKEA